MRRIWRWLDPRIREEGLQFIHWYTTTALGLVCGVIFGFLVAFGAFEGGHAALSWAQRIQQARTTLHARGGITVPPQRVYIAPKTGGRPLPHSGSILMRYFMGTTNQGSTYSCAAQGAAKSIAYEVSRATKRRITISPRQLYDLDTNGAPVFTSVSDYNRIIAQNGTVSTRVLDYGPHQRPTWISQWGTEPVPAFARFGTRRATHTSYLWYYQGAGYGAVQRAREAIHARRAVSIGSDWYFNAEKSSWTTGKMGLPVHGDWVEYGHTVVLVRYNDTIPMLDGTRGAFLASNSFGTLYGRNSAGAIQRGHGGYVWISYAYIARYAAYGTVEDLGYAKTGGSGKYAPNPAPGYKPPFDPGPQTGGTYSYWVHNVHLYNNAAYQDISPLINSIGSAYHVWPVAIAAVIGTESGFNPNAERWAGGIDNSCGLMQQILINVYARIGNVGAIAACRWEEVPSNSISYGTSILHDDQVQHPAVPWPNQDVFYNMGSGISDATAWSPYGQGAINFNNDFLPNYRYSLAYFMGGGGPSNAPPRIVPRPVFRLKLWCAAYLAKHVKGCPNPYFHKKLGVVASYWTNTPGLSRRIGGVSGRGIWHRKRRFMSQAFFYGTIYSWPTRRGWHPKVSLRKGTP